MADTKIKLPEPVDYQIRLVGGCWTHCAKHIHEAAIESGAAETRALYSADQMISFRAADNAALRAEIARTNERWEKSHQIALAIQDERDALRERVKVLEDALRLALAELDELPVWSNTGHVCNIARAALEVSHG